MRNTMQMNLRISKKWKDKLDRIAQELSVKFNDPDFTTQDLIRLALSEKFKLE
jgi:hypothetical protein